jgi:GntR family transcriptional regulator
LSQYWLKPVKHCDLDLVNQLAQTSCRLAGMTSHLPDDQDKQLPSRRIAQELRKAIAAGTLAAGTRLPSERTLADQYGTARNTAREAIRLLAEEGLVTAEHGRGVFVRGPRPLIRLGNDRYSSKYRESGLSPFLLECERQGKTGRFQVLSIDAVEAPSEVAEQLHLEEGAQVLRRENVFYADDDPVYRVTTFIPWAIVQGTGLVEIEVPHAYGIHGVLEDQGYAMARLQDTVVARMPTPEETRHLQLASGVPVLDVNHVSLTDQNVPYELTRFVMRADMNALLYNAPIE